MRISELAVGVLVLMVLFMIHALWRVVQAPERPSKLEEPDAQTVLVVVYGTVEMEGDEWR